MDRTIIKERNSLSRSKRRQKLRLFKDPTREEIERAMHEFISKGGKIKRIEPKWIEEGRIYMFD